MPTSQPCSIKSIRLFRSSKTAHFSATPTAHFSATSPTLEARWVWLNGALDALVISGHKSHFAPKHLVETLTSATIAQALVDSAERRETSDDLAIASFLDVCRCKLSTVAHWLIDFERHVAVLDEKGFRCCHSYNAKLSKDPTIT